MKNIKIFATFCICLLLFSACSDDWKENALTAKFSFDKSLYYVGDEVRITNETVGGEGNYTYEWDLGDGKDFNGPQSRSHLSTKRCLYGDSSCEGCKRHLCDGSQIVDH